MKKYLVDIYLPCISRHYDVFLPASKYIADVISLLIDMVEPLSYGNFKGSESTVLINADHGEMYDPCITVFDAGIRNSARLILV